MKSNDTIEALRLLQEIENAQGSNAKKAKLAEGRDNEVLRQLCFAAYGGDKYSAYPTIEFDDAKGFSGKEDAQMMDNRYNDFIVLLIELRDRKLTGNDAVETIDKFLSSCYAVEKKWYRRVLEHDLKIGMNSSYGKLWDFKMLTLEGKPRTDGVIYPGCALCEKDEKIIPKKWGDTQLLVEPKFDGLRLVFVWTGKEWSFFSRSGKNARYNDNLKHIAEDLIQGLQLAGYTSGVVDGEIMGEDWNSTLAVKRKELTEQDLVEIQRCKFYAFDHLEAKSDIRPQRSRRKTLEKVVGSIVNKTTKVALTPQIAVKTLEEAKALYTKYVLDGFEGAIVKHPEMVYPFDNKRSKEWIKLKPIDTQDVRVTGFYEGEERSRNEGRLGGFTVVDQAGQKFKVGGGFTDKQRDELWANRDKYVGKWMEIEFQPDPKQVAVGRFPVFTRWREDLE